MSAIQNKLVGGLMLLSVVTPDVSLAQGEATGGPPSATGTEAVRLKEVSVTATRTERPVEEIPATVTVIDEQEIEQHLVTDIKDLTRYEPGVSVRTEVARFGNSGFNIRGIDGNRVLILLDGVRVPDQLVGGPIVLGRDLVDMDSLKTVEIVRGSASSLYGSDAIGGVVAYATKDPADYLAPDRPRFASLKGQYSSADRGAAANVTFAAGGGAVEGMLLYTRRDAAETDNQGTNNASGASRTTPNPQDIASNGVLAKFVFHADPQNQFKFTVDGLDRDTATDVISNQTSTVQSQLADDNARRARFSLGHEYTNPAGGGFQKARWQVYYQDASTKEHVDERRLVSGTNRLRVSDFQFLQTLTGVEAQLESNFPVGSAAHRLIYGLDASLTDTSRPRDRIEYNLTAGTSTKTVAGETFPNKTFPDTDMTRAGAYVQDEIAWDNSRFTLIPGLRYDTYKMTPHPDAEFANANLSGFTVKPVRESALSPKLGALYQLTSALSVYGQYARGFRSPPFDSAQTAFSNFALGYEVMPNPDLKAERSDGFEIGLRGRGAASRFGVALFDNRYRDFIDTVLVSAVDTNGNGIAQEFQARNLTRVRIRGAEARGDLDLGGGFSVLGALAYAKGDNEETHVPLDSIDPVKAVLGLRYGAGDRWGMELVATAVEAKDRVSSATLFKAPGYGTLDVLGHYRFSRQASLNWGVFNLADKKYWQWSDVRGVATTDVARDRYTQPGRNASANFKYQF